jgi:hypothetical protein
LINLKHDCASFSSRCGFRGSPVWDNRGAYAFRIGRFFGIGVLVLPMNALNVLGFISRRLSFLVCVALSLVVISCASVRQDKLSTFSDGISAAKNQANTAFVAVNALASDAIIDYAAKQTTLDDKYFFEVLDSESIGRWNDVFSAMEKYSQSLVTLTGTDITKNYRNSTSDLASQMTETSQKLKTEGLVSSAPQLSAGLATAFAELGNVLLEAKASRDAKNAIRKADPTVQKIFVGMADVIGANGKKGIRGTVYTHWELIKGAKKVDFLSADPAGKRSTAADFADAMSKQMAQDLMLASLQKSLRALAEAHHALALDSKFEVKAAIAMVEQEAKNTKEISDKMQVAVKP